jgi:hypothetical protein
MNTHVELIESFCQREHADKRETLDNVLEKSTEKNLQQGYAT